MHGRTVRYERFKGKDLVASGDMQICDVDEAMKQQVQLAEAVIRHGNYDHVIYAAKIYDENEHVRAIQFYILPLDDDRFIKLTKKNGNSLIYALHRRKEA